MEKRFVKLIKLLDFCEELDIEIILEDLEKHQESIHLLDTDIYDSKTKCLGVHMVTRCINQYLNTKYKSNIGNFSISYYFINTMFNFTITVDL